MSNTDSTTNNEFTMEVANDIMQLLDLTLKFNKESKRIYVDISSKATNSYVLPRTCFPKNNIENIPKSLALSLRYLILTVNLRTVVQNTKNI